MSGAMINTRLIAERRNALNMSRRALNKAASVGHHAIHADDPGAHTHATMTLGELSRVAAALGLTAAELLTAPDATPDRPPTPDAAVLVAALMDEVHMKLVFRDDIARAFGWPIERVHAAVREAAVHLPALGLDIHQTNGLRVHVAHGVLADDVQQRLARAKTLRRHMRLDAARVLREVAHGRGDARGLTSPSNKQRVPIQGLRKRDLIEDTPTRLVLTDTAAYSLMLTDEPPAEPVSRPAGVAQPPIGGWLHPPRSERQQRAG